MHVVKAINSDAVDNLKQFWKAHIIKNCMTWDDMNASTVNTCQQCLWPEAMNDLKGYPTIEKEDGCLLGCCTV
jgi:hypothetical protein